MQPARPLRDVFDELAGGDLGAGPADALADSGHGDLPDRLVSEAIVSYADTAAVEVAEHLAPFVKVHSAVPGDPADPAELAAGDGLALLAGAPEQVVMADQLTDGLAGDGADLDLPEPAAEPVDLAGGGDPDALDFGFGSGAGDQPADAQAAVEEPEPELGATVEPGPPPDLAAPVEGGTGPAYPWVAAPDADEGGGGDVDDTVDG